MPNMIRKNIQTVLFTTLLVLDFSCGGNSTSTINAPPPAPPAAGQAPVLRVGTWGGQNSVLTVQDFQSDFRRDCRTGQITGQIVLDQNNSFDVSGTITESNGGPVHPDDIRKARFQGTVSGNILTLVVSFTDSSGHDVQFDDVLTFGAEGPHPHICPL
jgi:hypothetical protein